MKTKRPMIIRESKAALEQEAERCLDAVNLLEEGLRPILGELDELDDSPPANTTTVRAVRARLELMLERLRYKNPDDDPRGPWRLSDLTSVGERSRGRYGVRSPSGKIIRPVGRHWKVSQERFNQLDRDKLIWWGSDAALPRFKRFLSKANRVLLGRI